LLIQTSNVWAEEWIDADRGKVEALLLQELETLTSITQEQISHCVLHGWRYANTPKVAPNDAYFLLDQAQQLAACGDWCMDGRVEGAFLSGNALGEMLRNMGAIR
jgi:predicted NAD/FAD-dependent oxidoreductase